jgi:hypothetical protein
MKLIAFVGLKQSGKSTACAYLESKLPDTVRVNFKDALVQETFEGFPDLLAIMSYHYYSHDMNTSQPILRLFDEKPPLMRALMQNFGTDVRRKQDPEYWVKRWKDTVSKQKATVLTDDVRFVNEAQAVKDAGGILIRLDRTDMTNTDTHSSETEQANIVCDHTITCSKGEHEKLYKALDDILGL